MKRRIEPEVILLKLSKKEIHEQLILKKGHYCQGHEISLNNQTVNELPSSLGLAKHKFKT